MRAIFAWLIVATLLGCLGFALLAPATLVTALLVICTILMRKGRGSFVLVVATSIVLYAGLLAFVSAEAPTVSLLGHGWSLPGAREGAEAAIRMVTVLGVNLTTLSLVEAPVLLDGMRLPRRVTVTVAAVLLAATDLQEDQERLIESLALDRDVPQRRWARWRAAASLMPALFVSAQRRAVTRRDALRSGGIDMGAEVVPILAIASLAAAARLFLIPLPNVKLTFAVVFLGGLVWGWRPAFLGGALGMLVTDVMLSGWLPTAFVNAPAIGAIGALGACARRVDFMGPTRAERWAGRVFAFIAGLVATLLFSVLADATTWVVFLRSSPQALAPLLVGGIAFNALPAIGNGLLFAWSVGPVQQAFRALRGGEAVVPGPATEAGVDPGATT